MTHIVGQRRYTIRIKGESNHAGTTPMQYRKDAVSTAAYLISFLTEKTKEWDPHLVATVGKLSVSPNVPNVIAGEVEFSLDIRHHMEEIIDQYCNEIFAEFKQIAENLNIEVSIAQWMDVKPVRMDVKMGDLARRIAKEKTCIIKK